MTDDQIIAKQQREIEDLKRRSEVAVDYLRKAHLRMVCVGGPLNDNRLGYTSEQMADLWFICRDVENAQDALVEGVA